MKGISEFKYRGKEILCMDIQNLSVNDKPEFIKLVEQAKEQIRKRSQKSVLIVTDVTNARYDNDIVEVLKDYVKHNNPYIKASAVVGLTGLQKIILYGVKILTGRDFYLANSFIDAQEWLIKQ